MQHGFRRRFPAAARVDLPLNVSAGAQPGFASIWPSATGEYFVIESTTDLLSEVWFTLQPCKAISTLLRLQPI